MAPADLNPETTAKGILTPEQDALLDRYLQHLDVFFEHVQEAEKTQVEIETRHLQKILGA